MSGFLTLSLGSGVAKWPILCNMVKKRWACQDGADRALLTDQFKSAMNWPIFAFILNSRPNLWD